MTLGNPAAALTDYERPQSIAEERLKQDDKDVPR